MKLLHPLLSVYRCFFFLMIRRPPRSTLFPYTTPLPISSASSSGGGSRARGAPPRTTAARASTRSPRWGAGSSPSRRTAGRSEEHTSELQSRQYLVCRLLLEKTNSVRDTAAERRN